MDRNDRTEPDVPHNLNESALQRLSELVEGDRDLDDQWKAAVTEFCITGFPVDLQALKRLMNGEDHAPIAAPEG